MTALETAGKDDSTNCIFSLIVVEGVCWRPLPSLSHCLLKVAVGVCPQCLLVLSLELESLILTRDPGIEYPFLEESSGLEEIVTPSVADIEVVDIKLSW